MPDDPSIVEVAPTPVVAPPAQIEQLPGELLWLLDAPLFIDELQVNAFYDAVLRPDYEGASVTLSNSITSDTTIGAKATVGANIPWFVKAEGEVSGEYARGRDSGRDTTYTPISNAYRHLLALALHYAADPVLRSRLIIADMGKRDKTHDAATKIVATQWLDPAFIRDLPRAVVFLDVPKGGKFIPAALELTNGEVLIVADGVAEGISHIVKEYPKEYPGSNGTEEQKDEYFEWFDRNFDDRIALKVLEEAVKEHRSAWVDFNIEVKDKGEVGRYLHLHIAGRGQYDTGVFAYNLITRGFNHGVRIVGTLKSGPDLNVLAIFES